MTDEFIKGHRRQNQPMEQFDGLVCFILLGLESFFAENVDISERIFKWRQTYIEF